MLNYVLSQVFVVIAMACLGASYFVKSKKYILILNLLCTIFFAVEYLFLEAYAACAINLISLIRIPWFYIDERYEKKDYISLIVISAIVIGCGIWTYKWWPDILVIFQGVLFTYSIWQKNVAVYRWIAPISSALFVIYDVMYKNILGIVFESCLVVMAIVSIIKMYVDKKKSKTTDLSDNKSEENSDEIKTEAGNV